MNENPKKAGRQFFLQFLISPKCRLYRHGAFILYIILSLYNNAEWFTNSYIRIGLLLLLLTLFYLNMYLFVPKLLFKNNYAGYFIAILVLSAFAFFLVTGVRYLMQPDANLFHNKRGGLNVLRFEFLFLMLMASSSGIKLFQRWVTDSARINELERITMQSELEQLKNQINPHFLFNMLNNANVLIQKDPGKASQVLMKLSDLLRYQLYDSSREKVLLTSDIHFLTDFLNLENIRRDNFEFIVSKEGEISGVQVPPLLFITFVENAVKHSMDAHRMSYIQVYFDVSDGKLSFCCINSKPLNAVVRNGTGGLGLANVKRTLQLLYPQKHQLVLEEKPNMHKVTLTITL